MALLAIAYPRLAPGDLEWIQEIRSRHDARFYGIVDPHFTLVFPVEGVGEERFTSHVRDRCRGRSGFRFVLRCAVPDKDGFHGLYHTFLVPDEGYSDIVKLHDRLYEGDLRAHLRIDLPYIPHIGMGNSEDAEATKALVDRINAQGFEVEGEIGSLTAIRYDGSSVEGVTTIPLDGE